jgi:hypothetical protein
MLGVKKNPNKKSFLGGLLTEKILTQKKENDERKEEDLIKQIKPSILKGYTRTTQVNLKTYITEKKKDENSKSLSRISNVTSNIETKPGIYNQYKTNLTKKNKLENNLNIIDLINNKKENLEDPYENEDLKYLRTKFSNYFSSK